MTDGDDTRAVQVARLEGRVDGIERALARQEDACERRAREHVDIVLYQSERDAMKGMMQTVHAEVGQARMDVQALERKLTDQRRWVIGVVIVPVLGTVVVVLMGVLA